MNPYAVITGASNGIGLELAKQFAQNGYDLLICSQSDAIHTAAMALRSLGASVDVVQADLAHFDGVEKLVASITRTVDAVAINAGVGVGGDFTKTDLQEELSMISLNVTSTVHLAKRLVPDMVARKQGKVLFTASIAATMPAP